ncbi:hypothetical protein, partial [Methylobacter sp.]|uniref:hypothetical protein n=1 Tax=Methylobacter sp. TaxID=2051955 RepID=UPI0025D852C1
TRLIFISDSSASLSDIQSYQSGTLMPIQGGRSPSHWFSVAASESKICFVTEKSRFCELFKAKGAMFTFRLVSFICF